MKSRILTLLTAMTLLAALAVPVRLAAQYNYSVLHSFGSNTTDGQYPPAGLIQDAAGNLYGTTSQGGANTFAGGGHGGGTIFKLDTAGQETVLYSFCSVGGASCTDGEGPHAGLIQDALGNLFGTTYSGGAHGDGTVFKLAPPAQQGDVWTETVLYSFCSVGGASCTDGYSPEAGLTQDDAGNLYGTANLGGYAVFVNGVGTVFKLDTTGHYTVLDTFCSGGQPCWDAGPASGLIQDAAGNLYGTTANGGGYHGAGDVFELDTTGHETVLHAFCWVSDCPWYGMFPEAGLIQDAAGNLYGTTISGGYPNNGGTVFRLDTTRQETVLYSFCSVGGANCTDGAAPRASLIRDAAGNLYGTTSSGGAFGAGTVFGLDTTGQERVLYSFCSVGGANCTDGAAPMASLIRDAAGNLYGTTSLGGAFGAGTVFKLFSSAAQFVPVSPCRVVDTRNPNGPFGGPAIAGGRFRSFTISSGSCNIPTTATAYSLNVTAVPWGGLGYLTVWPAGEGQPLVSTLNSLRGRVKANAAIVPAGSQGAVSVYVTNTTDVVLDINGYFEASSSSTLEFYPLTPCRVADTRGPAGPLGGPFLNAKVERDFPVSSSTCSIPSSAQAYSLNFTAVPKNGGELGYLTVWPQGQTQPLVSTLNDLTGTIVANAAIVAAGTDGGIAVYATDATDLVIDVNGYFAAPASGGLSLYPQTPCRVLDTRESGAFSGVLPVNVVNSQCMPPSTAQAYVFNATVVPEGALGYLTLWPEGDVQPLVSTLNALDGDITSNMAVVPNIDGHIDAYADGATQLLLDLSAYFAP